MKQAFIQEWEKEHQKVPYLVNNSTIFDENIGEVSYKIRYKWMKKQPK